MKMSLYYLSFIIMFLSCKKHIKSIPEDGKLNLSLKKIHKDSNSFENKTYKESKNNEYRFSDTLKQWSLPIGNKLLLTNFPKNWQFDPETPEGNGYEVTKNSLYKFTDSLLYHTKYFVAKDSSNCQSFSSNQYYKYYDDYTYYNCDRNIKTSLSVPVAKLANQNTKIDIIFEIEDNPSGSSFINIKTIDKKRHEIDATNIGYTKNVFEFSHSGKYFYIDENRIINIKSFLSLENETLQNYSEKFQILSSGKIVRYFDNDGEFKSNSEIGKIKNHIQVGKWTEIKDNKYVRKTTFATGDYVMGKPIGNWQYFNLVNNTEKGSKLLMTEEYSDSGKLLKRELFNK